MIKIIFISVLSFVGFFGCSSAPVQLEESKLEYNYVQLKLMEIDDILEIIESKLEQFRETQNLRYVEQALVVSLSRPDTDNIVNKTSAQVRFGVNAGEFWNEAVENVLEDSIAALKYERTSATDQVTYIVLLHNMLLEIRHDLLTLENSLRFEKNILQTVKDAQIIVSKEALKEAALNYRTQLKSPSRLADEIIVEISSRPKSKKLFQN